MPRASGLRPFQATKRRAAHDPLQNEESHNFVNSVRRLHARRRIIRTEEPFGFHFSKPSRNFVLPRQRPRGPPPSPRGRASFPPAPARPRDAAPPHETRCRWKPQDPSRSALPCLPRPLLRLHQLRQHPTPPHRSPTPPRPHSSPHCAGAKRPRRGQNRHVKEEPLQLIHLSPARRLGMKEPVPVGVVLQVLPGHPAEGAVHHVLQTFCLGRRKPLDLNLRAGAGLSRPPTAPARPAPRRRPFTEPPRHSPFQPPLQPPDPGYP